MPVTFKGLPFASAAMSLCAVLGVAHAQEATESDAAPFWSIEATTGIASDYRYRGVSLSNSDPAWQSELTVSAANGFYVYGWVSTLADNGGDDVELMGILGWAGDLGSHGLSLDIGANFYTYPGVDESTMYEFAATLTQQVGDVSLNAGFSYFPEQTALWDMDDTYFSLGASTPLGFWGAEGSLGAGYEDGAFADEKIDWSAAVDVPISHFNLRVAYVGTDVEDDPLADDTLLFEFRYQFAFER